MERTNAFYVGSSSSESSPEPQDSQEESQRGRWQARLLEAPGRPTTPVTTIEEATPSDGPTATAARDTIPSARPAPARENPSAPPPSDTTEQQASGSRRKTRSRHWVFTEFVPWTSSSATGSPPFDPAVPLPAPPHRVTWDPTIMSYFIGNRETCPSTHRKHIQGFFCLHEGITETNARRRWPGVHLEPARGSPEENRKYCSKLKDGGTGDFSEHGILPAPGNPSKRNAAALALEGKSLKEICMECPTNAMYLGMNKILNFKGAICEPRTWVMDVRIYYGPTGAGKTRAVYDEFDYCEVYSKPTGPWWDGYDGQKVILVDDFVPADEPIDAWLRHTDRYPHKVPMKGSFAEMRSKIIIFTSNYSPDEWWFDKMHKDAFNRRVTSRREFFAPAAPATAAPAAN